VPDGVDELKKLFTAKPRPVGWTERRQRLDEVAAIDPPPRAAVFTPIRIGQVPAEWSLAAGSDSDRVLLYLHGGGYCSGSIQSHRGLVASMGIAAGLRTLALGYRLAPEHPFPAALQDAVAAYRFLLGQGIAPDHLAIGGDSAGAGLALALMLALRDAGEPLPAGGWLVSPWVDLQMTGESLASKAAVDPLIQHSYLQELAEAYLAGADASGPLVSPLLAALSGLPPMLIQVGSAETLLDDAVRLARALAAADIAVRLEVWPRMIHAWHLWAARLPAGAQAMEAAAGFLRSRLGG
jgi:acetyl esterase/lipase